MRTGLVIGCALATLAVARIARESASDQLPVVDVATPYAPSPGTAAFVSLGYREAMADLLWVRLTGYFGGDRSTSHGVAGLVEAIITLDPKFYRAYEWGARAIMMAHYDVDQESYFTAIDVLDKGTAHFPDEWRFPNLEGQIYTQDLETDDDAQKDAWTSKGILLVETAIRKPGAPKDAAEWAAVMRTKRGEVEKARQGLEEVLAQTDDPELRDRLIKQLADLEGKNLEQLRYEQDREKRAFDQAWRRERPALPATMYILLGPHQHGFDMGTLAVGGQDLVVPEEASTLEPLQY